MPRHSRNKSLAGFTRKKLVRAVTGFPAEPSVDERGVLRTEEGPVRVSQPAAEGSEDEDGETNQ